MDNKINEYLDQLNKEIKRYEEQLQKAKKELIHDIESKDFYTMEEFGTAKYAERITKLTGQLRILYEQRQNFIYIFEVEQ